MKRRAFLKLIIGTAVVATLPVPEFLLPKPKSEPFYTVPTDGFYKVSGSMHSSDGVLTQEMVENAVKKSLENFGSPDIIMMSEQDYWTWNAHYVKLKLVREA